MTGSVVRAKVLGKTVPAVLVLTTAIALAGCGAVEPPEGKRDVSGSEQVAEQLAGIHVGGAIVEERLIRRYQHALNRLEPKCREPRRRLGDMAVKSQQILDEEKGIKVKPLEMLQAANTAIPGSAAPMGCAEIFATVVFLTEEG